MMKQGIAKVVSLCDSSFFLLKKGYSPEINFSSVFDNKLKLLYTETKDCFDYFNTSFAAGPSSRPLT